jgi:hypothetical protein
MSDFDDFGGGNNNQQSGGGSFQRDTSKLGPIDDIKLRLYAEPVNGGKKKPSLYVEFFENNPRLVVKTNVDNDTDYGKIRAKLDMPYFFAMIDLLKSVIDGPNGQRPRFVNKTRKFLNNESKILDDSYVLCGKDDNGVVFISVLAYNKERPKIKFEFGFNDYHTIVNHDGTPYDKGKWSQHCARGWVEVVSDVLKRTFSSNWEYVDYFAKKGDRKAGGGNNNQGGNRGGGNQQRQSGGGYQNNSSQQQRSAQPAGNANNVQDNWGIDDDLPM